MKLISHKRDACASIAQQQVTTNRTDIETATTTMRNLDPDAKGFVSLEGFAKGCLKHSNLLAPAFNVQQHCR